VAFSLSINSEADLLKDGDESGTRESRKFAHTATF
jgi:hypothetical protein